MNIGCSGIKAWLLITTYVKVLMVSIAVVIVWGEASCDITRSEYYNGSMVVSLLACGNYHHHFTIII